MKLNHIAFWTRDINQMIEFYKKHFEGEILFSTQDGDFSCTFIRIKSDINIELMSVSDIKDKEYNRLKGYSHISFEVESREEVDRLTDYFMKENVVFEKVKQQYDDGFYESAVIDPDGNIIEIAFIDRNINNNI